MNICTPQFQKLRRINCVVQLRSAVSNYQIAQIDYLSLEKVWSHREIEPFKVMGIAVRTINGNNLAAKKNGKLWRRFMNENILGKIPNKVRRIVYSSHADYEIDHAPLYSHSWLYGKKP